MVLTLPVFGVLRQAFPSAFLEVMGNPGRAVLAQHPAYADSITDLERWDFYRLFSQRTTLSERLATYLRACDVLLVYLSVPDETFARHVRQYCPGRVMLWSPHPPAGLHVTEHLLQPVTALLQQRCDPRPHVYLDATALAAAERFWHAARLPDTGVVAFHPGSGGHHKLWPLAGWQRVMAWAAQQGMPCLLISGPADQQRLAELLQNPTLRTWPCATQLPLLHVAALLSRCQVVLGHDSGMTHLAAAVGTTTLALFGPTEPLMWGPRSPRACVIRPRSAGPLTLENLPPEVVIEVLAALYRGTFRFTPSAIDCTIVDVPG
jgi:heptosyltransferase-2